MHAIINQFVSQSTYMNAGTDHPTYIFLLSLTFELHHGKRILMSETVRNAGPGLFPEPAPSIMEFGAGAPRPTKRRMSLSPPP